MLPTVRVGDAALVERDTGRSYAEFTVTFSQLGHSVSGASVDYATADGTATLSDGDYQQTKGTLHFASGEVSKTIRVPVLGDRRIELDEAFFVNLSNARGGGSACGGPRYADRQGIGAIINNDPAATLIFVTHHAATTPSAAPSELDAVFSARHENSLSNKARYLRAPVTATPDFRLLSPRTVDVAMRDESLTSIVVSRDSGSPNIPAPPRAEPTS